MTLFRDLENLYLKARENLLTAEDLLAIARWPKADYPMIMSAANKLRIEAFGENVSTCQIINIKSGNCGNDCKFCAQSVYSNTDIPTFPLVGTAALIEAYGSARQNDSPIGFVSSGKKLSTEDIEAIITISTEHELRFHGSFGILTGKELSALKKAGMTWYHHNLETSRSFFPKIATTHSYEEKVETVRQAISTGLKVCSGGIFGIGESWEDRIELAMTLKELRVDSVPINFFIPVAGTRLPRPDLSPTECLQIISLFRFALPDKNIRICGGRDYHLKSLQPMMIYAGADGFMTGDYLTTKGAGIFHDNQMLSDLSIQKEPFTT